jgi:hypothetical protein
MGGETREKGRGAIDLSTGVAISRWSYYAMEGVDGVDGVDGVT